MPEVRGLITKAPRGVIPMPWAGPLLLSWAGLMGQGYKGGAAEIFRFDLLIDLRSDPSVSKVVQQLGFVVQ